MMMPVDVFRRAIPMQGTVQPFLQPPANQYSGDRAAERWRRTLNDTRQVNVSQQPGQLTGLEHHSGAASLQLTP